MADWRLGVHSTPLYAVGVDAYGPGLGRVRGNAYGMAGGGAMLFRIPLAAAVPERTADSSVAG